MAQVKLNGSDGVRAELDLSEALRDPNAKVSSSLPPTSYSLSARQYIISDNLLCSRTISNRLHRLNIIVDRSQLLEQLGREDTSCFEAP